MKKLKKRTKCRLYTADDKRRKLPKTRLLKDKATKLPYAPLCDVLTELSLKGE